MTRCTLERATSDRVSLIGFEQKLLAFLGQARRVNECRTQKALFIERVIKQRIHYIAPYIFDSVYRKTPADRLKTPGA